MDRLDLDLLLAVDLSRDETLLGSQRWLTGYIPVGGPVAALISRSGSLELVSDRIGRDVTEHYRANGFPIELVTGYSERLLADRIARHGPKRIGVAEPATVSFVIAEAVRNVLPTASLVDVSDEMMKLRMRKSAQEIALVRRSSVIADEVWKNIPDLFRVGRSNRDIVADVDHLARLQGAESGFHLILKLPFHGRPMRSTANPELIERGARYLVEVSPRFEGYYSQLTIPVSTVSEEESALRAYDDLVAAKKAAQPLMLPGAELGAVAAFVKDFLQERGRLMSSLSLGHFCGMALEEPRHDLSSAVVLEEGMTMIFHPVLADPELHSLMRADTYLITQGGAERLTCYAGGMLVLPWV